MTSTLPGLAIEVIRLARLTRSPVEVAGPRQHLTEADTRSQARETVTLRLHRRDQVERRREQRLGVGGGKHRRVADQLDEPDGPGRDVGGKLAEAAS